MDKKYHIDYEFVKKPAIFGDVSLVQLGRLYTTSSFVSEKHAHGEWFEITIITEGRGTIITNDVPLEVKKNDIYFSVPGDFHEIHSSTDAPIKYDFFSFNTINEGLRTELGKIVNNLHQYSDRIFQDASINELVANAIAEYGNNEIYRIELLEMFFKQIILYIIRDFSSRVPTKRKLHIKSADELCFQIMHYIDTNIFEINNLNHIAGRFNYNYSYLSSLFKQTTGNTIEEYYRTRRLETARLLLLDDNKLKVSKIADMLNYSSLYSFSKAFKLKYGVSPTHINTNLT